MRKYIMKMLPSFFIIGSFIFFSGCGNKTTEPKLSENSTDKIEKSPGDETLVREDGKLMLTIRVSDQYTAIVTLEPATGVVYQSINGGEKLFGELSYPVVHYQDIELASFGMTTRDANNDGYKDLVITNEQFGMIIEKINLFNPLSKEFQSSDDKYRTGTNIASTKGFLILDIGNTGFDDGENVVITNNADNSLWLEFRCGDIYNISQVLKAGMAQYYINWLTDFNPWLHVSGDRELIIFRCVGETSHGYQVIINEQTQEMKIVKKIKGLNFLSVEAYLSTSILYFDQQSQSLKEKPNDESATIEYKDDGLGAYSAGEISGNWVYITELDGGSNKGWIRWKKDERLIVSTAMYIE